LANRTGQATKAAAVTPLTTVRLQALPAQLSNAKGATSNAISAAKNGLSSIQSIILTNQSHWVLGSSINMTSSTFGESKVNRENFTP
jgi:hypothetical protein